MTLTFGIQMYRYNLPFSILHLCMKYESCTLKVTLVIVSETKVLTKFSCDLDLWPFDSKCIFLSASCIYVWNMKAVCIKAKSGFCNVPDTDTDWQLLLKVIVSEIKCRQSWVVTLTFDLLTPKCIGIFLSASCICLIITIIMFIQIKGMWS